MFKHKNKQNEAILKELQEQIDQLEKELSRDYDFLSRTKDLGSRLNVQVGDEIESYHWNLNRLSILSYLARMEKIQELMEEALN